MSLYFTATVLGARADEFRAVFGSDTVPICSPIPARAVLEGIEPDGSAGERDVFLLDVAQVEARALARLYDHLAQKFGVPVETVAGFVLEHGLPILASACVVQVYQPAFLN